MPSRSIAVPVASCIISLWARTQTPDDPRAGEPAASLDAEIAAMGDPDPAVAVAAQVALLGQPAAMTRLGEIVRDGWKGAGADWVRWRAIEVLGDAGPRGAPALPALVDALRGATLPDPWYPSVVAAVGRIGLHAGDRKKLMSGFSASLWPYVGDTMDAGAAHRLRHLGMYLQVDGAGASVQALLAHVHEPHVEISRAALHALADRAAILVGDRAAIVEALTQWIEDPAVRGQNRVDRGLLTAASEAVLAFAPRHRHAWLGWCQALYHWNPARRIEAAAALGELHSLDALPWLARAARGAPDEVALAILDAIRDYGATAAPVAPLLTPLLAASSERVVNGARSLVLALAPDALDGAVVRAPVLEVLGCGMAREPRRALEGWLDGARGANRAKVLADPAAIRAYDAAASGVRWVPVRVFPDPGDPWRWGDRGIEAIPGAVLVSPPSLVGEEGRRSGDAPWLVYLLPAPLDRPVVPARVRFDGENATFAVGCDAEHRQAWRDAAATADVIVLCVDGVAVHMGSARHMSGTGDSWYGCRYVDEPWLERELERMKMAGAK